MKIKKIRISELKPSPYNPRKITDEQLNRLEKSIKEFDCVELIVWNERTGNVVSGHQRLKVLEKLGVEETDCVVVDLDDQKEKTLNIGMNKHGGDFDYPMLKDLITEIDTGDLDIELTGFDYDELEELISYTKDQGFGGSDPDEVPEFEDEYEPITKPGGIWKLGEHRLLCGDCTKQENYDLLLKGEKIDFVFTDPPYGVSYADKNNFLNTVDKGNKNQRKIVNDHKSENEIKEFWKIVFERLAYNLSETNSYYVTGPQIQGMMMMMMKEAGLPYRHVIIWVKNNHVLGRCDYNYKHEPIFFGWTTKHEFYGHGSMKTSVWEVDKPLKNDLHPTMKPIALIENAILNSASKEALCFDPFLGSGSTLIAAEKTGRKCYGMEIEPLYCDVIVKRWEEFTGEKAELDR